MAIDNNYNKGFFSYSRQNDKHDGGNLSTLRKSLEFELWAQTGERSDIFQDQEDISWGDRWKEKITKSLNSSKFLIAVITPSYLKSEACRFELEYFFTIEKKLGGQRILPLIYIDTPELKDTKDPFFLEINNRQWFDWTELRFSSLTSAKVKKQIAVFAKRIQSIIADEIHVNANENNLNIPNSVINIATQEKERQVSFSPLTVESKPEPKLGDEENKQYKLLSKLIPSSFHAPLPRHIEEIYKKRPLQQITITLRSTDDIQRDRRRIKTLYGTLISFHGKDKFSFQIFNDGNSHTIDFPSDTTRISPELLERLKRLMGEENWHIEEISFQ